MTGDKIINLNQSLEPKERDYEINFAGFERRLAALEAHPLVPKNFIKIIKSKLEK